MNKIDEIYNLVLQGFGDTYITTSRIIVTFAITFALATYVFFVYRIVTKKTFYNRSFNVSMAIISLVTAGIILSMQSSLIVSLGMVGALSIVRFRTAIKEPMDLLFLFWSISIGIICGVELYKLATILSFVVTIGLILLSLLPAVKSPYILIIKANKDYDDQTLVSTIKNCGYYRLDSKSINSKGSVDMIIETRTKKIDSLLSDISSIQGIVNITFMHHDGEIKS